MTDQPAPETRRLTWHGADPMPEPKPGLAGWLRIAARGVPLVLFVLSGIAVLLLLRAIEKPLFGLRRPASPRISQWVSRGALAIMGLRFRVEGTPMTAHGAVVANHSSWLDILALNAPAPVYFISKEEVASWPGIGWMARANGTIFIKRERREASAQVAQLRARLAAGDRIAVFPEGTSSDGLRVLPFKPTLFAAFLTPELVDLEIQPVSLVYRAPEGANKRFYGWWGDMSFGPHMLRMLSAPRHGSVTVMYHIPVSVGAHPDRKALARQLETAVRRGLVEAGVIEADPA